MEIVQNLTLEDKVALSLILSTKTGEMNQFIKQLTRMEIVSIAGLLIMTAVLRLYTGNISSALIIVLSIFCIRSIIHILYRKKGARKNLKQIYTKYYQRTMKQHNTSVYHEKLVFTDTYIESEVLGTITRLQHEDFLGMEEDSLFYVLVYTNQRYIFIKKEAFTSKEAYQQLKELLKIA